MDRLGEMELFVAAATAGGLSAAARAAGVTPSAASRALSRLEERLGAALVERTTRTFTLTEAGTRYLADCRRLLADVQLADRRAADAAAGLSGTLRLWAPPLYQQARLLGLLARLQQARPALCLELSPEGALDLWIQLTLEGLDTPPAGAGDAHLLETLETHLYASPDYLQRADEPWLPEDLPGHRWLLLERPGAAPVPQPGLETLAAVQVCLRTPDWAALRAAALAGLGIALLPDVAVAADVAAGRLQPILHFLAGPRWQVWACLPERAFQPPRVQALLEVLRAPR